MDVKGIMLSEKGQPQMVTYSLIPFLQHSLRDKTLKMEIMYGFLRGRVREWCDYKGIARDSFSVVTEQYYVLIVTVILHIYTWITLYGSTGLHTQEYVRAGDNSVRSVVQLTILYGCQFPGLTVVPQS